MHLICWQTPPYSSFEPLQLAIPSDPYPALFKLLSMAGSPKEANGTIQLLKTRQICVSLDWGLSEAKNPELCMAL